MQTSDPLTFGDLLKQVRTRHHVTQAALAARLGVNFNTISKWERKVSLPERKDTVQAAACHLGLTTQEARQLYSAWVLERVG